MIGTQIAHYGIIEELGKGGMASVYRAYDTRMERFVAIKIIHRDLGRDSDDAERFRREARLISRLAHPHLIPVFDFSAEHEPPYMVMRYLEGPTLKDILTEGVRLPLGEVAHLMQQICGALDYAHEQGVIHRDIKPGNILIDAEGNAYLTDFGIARDSQQPGITRSGVAIGTPGYMSPEQSYATKVDRRADVYGLGVILYEMLTLEPPYRADKPMALLVAHVREPIPTVYDKVDNMPAGIDDIVSKAMAKNASDRYASAKDFSAALVELAGRAALETPVTLKAAARELMARTAADRDDAAIAAILDDLKAGTLPDAPAEAMTDAPVAKPDVPPPASSSAETVKHRETPEQPVPEKPDYRMIMLAAAAAFVVIVILLALMVTQQGIDG